LSDTGLDKGAQIGRYMIVESVGSGAMGVVYGAYDPELDRKIALKLIKPGHGAKETARERLLREAKAMARLQHPNVVAVHDVGVFEGQVFLAMEFLGAGTLKSWLAEEARSWREIVKLFVAAGRGLAAAHAAGIVHRDFKPDNVLLDKDGRARVVDFGIAREAGGAADDETSEAMTSDPAAHLGESSGSRPLLTLTKTGVLIGTPAYMAPEQFLGERGDERSDQFSFCVALYEALYGQRPFAGDDMLSISVNVTQERLRPLPKDHGVPAWVRRVIVRGLRVNPTMRWPSMSALIEALQDDPALKARRRIIAVGGAAVVAISLAAAGQVLISRRRAAEREVALHLADADHAIATINSTVGRARELRTVAFQAFDALNKAEGERAWSQVRALVPAADAGYDQAARALEAAFLLDSGRVDVRSRIADLRYEHFLFAEDFRLEAKAQLVLERLAAVDVDGARRKALGSPGTLTLRTTPTVGGATLEAYERDTATGRRSARPIRAIEASGGQVALPPGSYRLRIEGSGLAPVVYPFEIHRGQRLDLSLAIPQASAVPDGFVYVGPGEFWFGDADELLRTQFFDTVPMHLRRTSAYLIARRETTYADWIAFLDTLPEGERTKRAPNVSTAIRGSLSLRQTDDGWQLAFQPMTRRYSAHVGEAIDYVGRTQRVRQDWSQFPVAGVSPEDAAHYARWLNTSGRVPGARLCTELEWERAARGADGRLFPHGDELQPDDANYDVTYGRVDTAYGPDVVGSHPLSKSPFGVDDLAGNVFELVTSAQKADEIVIRGGAYYFKPINCRTTNREPVPPTFRDVTVGIRICSGGNQ
jgi:formylglycine-generating enzyme required for sulfatase activity